MIKKNSDNKLVELEDHHISKSDSEYDEGDFGNPKTFRGPSDQGHKFAVCLEDETGLFDNQGSEDKHAKSLKPTPILWMKFSKKAWRWTRIMAQLLETNFSVGHLHGSLNTHLWIQFQMQ